jgi:hypothetical protein
MLKAKGKTMKAIILILLMGISTTAFAQDYDRIIQDAIKHGAHGKSYQQMRDLIDLGCHYDAKHNDWTTEPNDRLPPDWNKVAKRHWVTFDEEGVIRIIDGNGEVHLMQYFKSRGLMQGGHKVIENGHSIWQVQLLNGRWVDVLP